MSRLKAFLDVAKQHLDKMRGTDRRKVKKLKAKVKSLRAEIRDWDKAQEENLGLLTTRSKQIDELHSAFGSLKDHLGVSHSLSLWDSVLTIKNIYDSVKADATEVKKNLAKCVQLERELEPLTNVVNRIKEVVGLADTMQISALPEIIQENIEAFEALQDDNQKKRETILHIREAADIQPTVSDGLIATCIRDKMGEIATLNAALKHANVEFTKVWAHREKGGRYRNLGEVIQAGTFADKNKNKEYVAYQCLESGNIYIREGEDFDNRMSIIENLE